MFWEEPSQESTQPFHLFKSFTVLVFFRALVRDFDVSLWPNRDVYAPGVVFEHVTAEGPQPIPYDMGTFYKGLVKGECMYGRGQQCACAVVCVCIIYPVCEWYVCH